MASQKRVAARLAASALAAAIAVGTGLVAAEPAQAHFSACSLNARVLRAANPAYVYSYAQSYGCKGYNGGGRAYVEHRLVARYSGNPNLYTVHYAFTSGDRTSALDVSQTFPCAAGKSFLGQASAWYWAHSTWHEPSSIQNNYLYC